ncbi:hypothetical protein HAX54_033402 [Datura stramonium]|uniref:Uncharacterized protein n=1 Tax=Datura stramonium TaxID=4076 RepID=A0ABS8VC87_DATST|nr:hypothetical protein [Datura stramonium]
MHGFECEKEVRNPLFDSDSPTPVVAFLSVTSKVTTSASATRLMGSVWHLLNGRPNWTEPFVRLCCSKLTLEKVSPCRPVPVGSTFRFLKRATILLARPVHLRAHHQPSWCYSPTTYGREYLLPCDENHATLVENEGIILGIPPKENLEFGS